jgi:hypothetical protein
MTAVLLAAVAQAPLPGVKGAGVTATEVITVICALVILLVVAVWVRWGSDR